MTSNQSIIWEHAFPEPCTITNITLNNTTRDKDKYWTYTCELSNRYLIKWSMTSAQLCCESYLTFIGKFPDRDSVLCTEYDTNIQDIRSNVLAVVSRTQSNITYSDLKFTQFKIVASSEDTEVRQACGKNQSVKSTARLLFGNSRLDPVQLGIQCIGQYSHTALLELICPDDEPICEKTFILC
jgi:hypothetical protein